MYKKYHVIELDNGIYLQYICGLVSTNNIAGAYMFSSILSIKEWCKSGHQLESRKSFVKKYPNSKIREVDRPNYDWDTRYYFEYYD